MQPNLQYLNQQPPVWLALLFGLITAITVVFFYVAIRKAMPAKAPFVLLGLLVWLALPGVLASQDFFTKFDAMPPRLMLVLVPTIGLSVALFLLPAGRQFYDALPLQTLTYLHIIRIPVEFVLFQLFINHQIPEMMTFEGSNFDILSGITAPIVAYVAFQQHRLTPRWLLVWNVVCLGLLLTILTIAILSFPVPFQQLNFDQPNVGVAKFPFIWLPGFVVPVVGLSHVIAIRQLIRQLKQSTVTI